MPEPTLDEPLEHTEGQLDETEERVLRSLQELTHSVDTLAGHMAGTLEHLARLQPVQAVAEVPAAAGDIVTDAGTGVGNVVHTAGSAIQVPGSVVEDVVDDTGSAAKEVSSTGKKFMGLKRRKR